MFYVGCPGESGCDKAKIGVGLARSQSGRPFERLVTEHALVTQVALSAVLGPYLDVGAVATAEGTRAYVSRGEGILVFDLDPAGTALEPATATATHEPAIPGGASGAWDEGAVCCASPLVHDGQVWVWYAAQAKGDPVWRIGLATSADGLTFTKHEASPLVIEGGAADFDARGARDPEVTWDEARRLFRLWFVGTDFVGASAVGYAVSTDGLTWHKYPENPVLVAETLGLEEIGSPAVLADEGELRMWVHGRAPGDPRFAIYAVENPGQEYVAP
jgi:hypothetical protein